MRILACLVALLVAGCVTPADPSPDAGAAPPAPTETVLMPCVEHASDVPVDAADAARHLPQGMRPRPAVPGGTPLLEVVAVECVVGEATTRAVFVWMLVEPPEELRVDGVAGFLYVFAAVTDDPVLAANLTAAGVPVTMGTVEFGTTETPLSVMGTATAATDEWRVSVETLVPKRQQMRVHPVIRGFVGNETGVTHAVDVDGGSHPHHDPGEGTIRVAGEAPFPTPTAPGIGVHGIDGHLGFKLVGPGALMEPVTS